jgi:predicted dehydrogenase
MKPHVPVKLVLIGLGPVASYKYSRLIFEAIDAGVVSSYSIVDLVSQRSAIEARRRSLSVQPDQVLLLPDEPAGRPRCEALPMFARWAQDLAGGQPRSLKVLIATEPQSHEAYLRYCISAGFDTLTTKPLVVPMEDGRFEVALLKRRTEELSQLVARQGGNHAVLCLGRHHEVYEHAVRQPLESILANHAIPVTSAHIKTASGVWNLPGEYSTREDHPYKYGYGMLMHGAYHYVDILTRLLLMNRRLHPHDEFILDVSAYSASPSDQSHRVPKIFEERLTDYNDAHNNLGSNNEFGETDIVGIFRLRLGVAGPVLALGTVGLEQTTPGMRSWAPFPVVPYNVNGRLHATDVDVRMSTAFGIAARVLKVPIGARRGDVDLRARNVAWVSQRSNALMLGHQEFVTEHSLQRPYGDSFSYRAEREIFIRWISGRETYSNLASHVPTAAVLEALGLSIQANGLEVSVSLSYDEPDWPPKQSRNEPHGPAEDSWLGVT